VDRTDLRIKRFYGASENAVKMKIWIAVNLRYPCGEHRSEIQSFNGRLPDKRMRFVRET